MHYKKITLFIFVVLMLLTMTLFLSETAYGLFIIGVVVPVLVVIQVFVVLTAKDTATEEHSDGKYGSD